MEVHDFLFGEDGDLAFFAGDLLFGESTQQHQRDILIADKGDVRPAPLLGVGIRRSLNDAIGAEELRAIIQREMERDGMRVRRLHLAGSSLENSNIDLEASYG